MSQTLLPVIATPQTLATLPEEGVWLANFISSHSKRGYSKAVHGFLAFHGLQTVAELREVKPAHLIAWRDSLLEEGKSPRTVNVRLSALSSLFLHLCHAQLVPDNPVRSVKRCRVNSDRVKTPAITPAQVRAMLNAPDQSTLKGMRDLAFLSILFFTGCRIAEACRLKVGDFHQDSGYWCLGFLVKGGKENRVAINPELTATLQIYFELVGHRGDKTAPLLLPLRRLKGGGHIAQERHLTTAGATLIFQSYADQVSLPDNVSPHSARTTFATTALEKGCPIEAVQKTLAHSQINTTRAYDQRQHRHRDSASFVVRY